MSLKLSSNPIHDNAYCWLLMRGDKYLPGIFTSIYSVLRTNPAADLVVMITKDVSEHAQNMLLKVATHLFYIPYLSFDTKPLKTERQREIYQSWISDVYSKWNMLALPYKKAILIDGDTIHLDNTDELFDLKAPAAPLASPFTKPYGLAKNKYKGPVGLDGYAEHGKEITPELMLDILNDGGVTITATPVLIEPDIKFYEEYKKMVKENEPWGCSNCHSAPDEQSITYFYAKKNISFHVMHHRYNFYPWKSGYTFNGDVPRILHFFSDTKPWVLEYNKFEDVTTWYKMAALAIKYANIDAEDVLLADSNISGAENAEDTYFKKLIAVDTFDEILYTLKN